MPLITITITIPTQPDRVACNCLDRTQVCADDVSSTTCQKLSHDLIMQQQSISPVLVFFLLCFDLLLSFPLLQPRSFHCVPFFFILHNRLCRLPIYYSSPAFVVLSRCSIPAHSLQFKCFIDSVKASSVLLSSRLRHLRL